MNFNKVMIAGNLTRDPDMKYTPNGTTYVNMAVAVNRKYKKDNVVKEETSFVRVIVWGRQAETVKEYCHKGKPVFVEGRLKVRSYDAEDGQRRTVTEVIAERVQFLNGGKGRTENNNNTPTGGDEEIFD